MPVATPVTVVLRPGPGVAVAIVGNRLVHVPPVGLDVRVTVLPWHTCVVPDIVPGNGFTVTGCVAAQPDAV